MIGLGEPVVDEEERVRILPHTLTAHPTEPEGQQPEPAPEPESEPEQEPEPKPEPELKLVANQPLDEILLADGGVVECSICLQAMTDPHAFPNPTCPHEFCAECLGTLLRTKRRAAPTQLPSQAARSDLIPPVLCPQCRRPASTELATLLAQLPAPPTPATLAPEEIQGQARRMGPGKCCIAMVAFMFTPILWWSVGLITNQLVKD